jgi:hypothetical protein
MTFLDETRFSVDVKTKGQSGGRHFGGTYTYQDSVLTFPAIYSWRTAITVPRAFHVTELSAHKLVVEDRWQNADVGDGYYVPTTYVTTDTYYR